MVNDVIINPDTRILDVDALVIRIKREINEDIAHGRVPATVTTFAALHDYVDANEYGGICHDVPFDIEDEQHMNAANQAQAIIDGWLKGGR